MITSQVTLNEDPARNDLTDREAAKLIGSFIGALTQMAGVNNVRRAVRWWAQQGDDVWSVFEEMNAAIELELQKSREMEEK